MECKLESSALRSFLPSFPSAELDDATWFGAGPAIDPVLRLADRAATVDAPVLIVGEQGTGTERIARRLHSNGPRRGCPFLTATCGSIPGPRLESELFGHERGAFPGAERDRIGLFAGADGGSLFLDEIGEASTDAQARLLRAIREREVWPLGSAVPRRIDVRVICATSGDLASKVRENRFLADLYCRINVIRIELAPLRERSRELPELCRRFLAPLGRMLDGAAIDLIQHSPWPGNARDLFHALHRAAALCRGPLIGPEHLDLPDAPTPPDAALEPLDRYLDRARRGYLLEVLRRSGWNRSRAAAVLRVDRTTVYRLMKKYGIES